EPAEDAEAATEEQWKTNGTGEMRPDPEASVTEEPHPHGRDSEISVQSDVSSDIKNRDENQTDSNAPADVLEETSGSSQAGWKQE
ncbi:hypothetical protein MOF05_22070, partial [Bacillus haynesii]